VVYLLGSLTPAGLCPVLSQISKRYNTGREGPTHGSFVTRGRGFSEFPLPHRVGREDKDMVRCNLCGRQYTDVQDLLDQGGSYRQVGIGKLAHCVCGLRLPTGDAYKLVRITGYTTFPGTPDPFDTIKEGELIKGVLISE